MSNTPPTPLISGLSYFVYRLREYFADLSYATPIRVGVREYFEQWNQGPGGADRVVVIAGEFHGEKDYRPRPYGNLTPPLKHRVPGASLPQPINYERNEVAQWVRPLTISVWAPPPRTIPVEDAELVQNDLTESLLERVRAGGQAVLAADLRWGEVERAAPPQERGFGEALLVHLEQRGPLYYPALDKAFPAPVINREVA